MTFLDVLSDEGVAYLAEGDKHCRPGWVQLECPFCGRGSNKHHLGYKLSTGHLSCWKCGYHSAVDTLAAITNKTWHEAKRLLSGVELVRGQAQEKEKRGTLVLPRGVKDLNSAHRAYLEARGFKVDMLVQLYGVRGIGLASELSHRIFIPIHYRNDVVSWTTRSIRDNAEQRYISASEEQEALNHKELLYGEDHCGHAVCCVEGPISSWAIGPGCVATCGTSIKRAQVLRLSKYPIRGICYDNEPEAQRRARALCDELSCFPGTTTNFVLDVKDPAEELLRGGRDLRRIRKELDL